MAKNSVLIIYTGGTIGMVRDHTTGRLKPVDFNNLLKEIPAIKKFNIRIDALFFKNPIDSSDVQIETWLKLVQVIENHYDKYDGFVVLHGTDTMSYTASALSFMIENLSKPIVFTGSQLPLETIRTDGKENLITALEIASGGGINATTLPEVCIYFESTLTRGNRTSKYSAEHFDAFVSPNYPQLAEAGVHIEYDQNYIRPATRKKTRFHKSMSDKVGLIRLFPGMREDYAAAIILNPNNKGIVIETFGSGNVPNNKWLAVLLKEAIDNGTIFLNITQCIAGKVEQGRYENSAVLNKIGVISGGDMTLEAAITKLMFLIANEKTDAKIKEKLSVSLAGEMD